MPSPPVPFADFEFNFDPVVHPLLSPSAIPSSADLFSQSETTHFLGFLDNFNWEFDPEPLHLPYAPSPPYHNPHLDTTPDPSASKRSVSRSPPHISDDSQDLSSAGRTKPLLTTPQKRLNHIMSEQKRRNAIRDGYAQLTTLLAPAGAPPGTGMPTRGRPKGSSSRARGHHGKGKSGVLFRAVEYCQWLEEGRDALQDEVLRLEAAAGIRQTDLLTSLRHV